MFPFLSDESNEKMLYLAPLCCQHCEPTRFLVALKCVAEMVTQVPVLSDFAVLAGSNSLRTLDYLNAYIADIQSQWGRSLSRDFTF
jgi:hypothetical protein